jgi:hypothetical protein
MADEPSNGELQRLIERNHLELREDYLAIKAELSQFVLREVYASDERSRNARFEAIEAELKRTSSNRILMATLAVTAFVGPIITGVVVFVVIQGLK